MTHGVFSVEADEGVMDVITKMCDENVRRVPVTRDGDLVGIVTLDDFVTLLATELNNLASVITAESPPYETD